jgi:hypothetical protein
VARWRGVCLSQALEEHSVEVLYMGGEFMIVRIRIWLRVVPVEVKALMSWWSLVLVCTYEYCVDHRQPYLQPTDHPGIRDEHFEGLDGGGGAISRVSNFLVDSICIPT